MTTDVYQTIPQIPVCNRANSRSNKACVTSH